MTEVVEVGINVLTAKVEVLMVGARQVTLSVYKQLDEVPATWISPMGRVGPGRMPNESEWETKQKIYVVGRGRDGSLVRSSLFRHDGETLTLVREWETLPLIVLAGLR